jgi:F-type H+-transporting ATPase subunit delta
MSLLPQEGERFIEFLKTNLKLSAHVVNFLDLLLHNERFGMIIDICDAYFSLLAKMSGKKFFLLTFAKKVPESIIEDFSLSLVDIFGGEVECIVNEDPSLIDGVKLQYRSRVLDYSLKSRLRRLHGAIRRENYEN